MEFTNTVASSNPHIKDSSGNYGIYFTTSSLNFVANGTNFLSATAAAINIYDDIALGNTKIYFDFDATNTFIYADTATPENLEIHADGNIELRADTEVEVYSQLDMFNNKIVFDSDATNTYIQANTETTEDLEIHADQDILIMADNAVGIKNSTPAFDLDVSGEINASSYITTTPNASGSPNGYLLDGTLAAWTSAGNTVQAFSLLRAGTAITGTFGRVYALAGTSGWVLTQNTTATSTVLLGIAIKGGASSNYFMTEGLFSIISTDVAGTYKDGGPLYLDASNNGQMTFTAPTTTGDFVRLVGHAVDSLTVGRSTYYQIYFRPSHDWIEL